MVLAGTIWSRELLRISKRGMYMDGPWKCIMISVEIRAALKCFQWGIDVLDVALK